MGETIKTVIVGTVFNLLATLLVILRLISRLGILKKSSSDDYLIVLAVLFSWGHTGSIYAQAHFGSGKHMQQIPPVDVDKLLFSLWLGLPLYNLALALAKVSALSQLLRFFTLSRTRTVAKVLIGMVSAYGLTVSVASILSCRPVHAFWNLNMWESNCINLTAFWYVNAAINIATDIAIVALPLYVLRDLNMVSRRQKIAVNAVFLIGAVACVTSILRFHSLYVLSQHPDLSYIIAQIEVWCAIEVNTAIICACMQSLKPLLDKIIPKWRPQDRASNTGSGNSNKKARLRRFWPFKKNHNDSPTSSSSMKLTEFNEESLPDFQFHAKSPSQTVQRAVQP